MGVSVVDTVLQADCLRGAQRFPYSLKALCDFLLHKNVIYYLFCMILLFMLSDSLLYFTTHARKEVACLLHLLTTASCGNLYTLAPWFMEAFTFPTFVLYDGKFSLGIYSCYSC